MRSIPEILKTIRLLPEHFRRTNYQIPELMGSLPQSAQGIRNVISILNSAALDATPDDFALRFVECGKKFQQMNDPNYKKDKIAQKHLPIAQRVALSGLHGDLDWQKFYESFRINNYLVQPKRCGETVGNHLLQKAKTIKHPNYTKIFGESVSCPGKAWDNLLRMLTSKVEPLDFMRNLGLNAVSTYRRGMDTITLLDEFFPEDVLLEDQSEVQFHPGRGDYIGRISRHLAEEGFRCLLIWTLLEDLCVGENYRLNDENKDRLFRKLIDDPDIRDNPWLIKTHESILLLDSIKSRTEEERPNFTEAETQKLLDAALRSDCRLIDRIFQAKMRERSDNQLASSQKADEVRTTEKSNNIKLAHRGIREEFYDFLDTLSESRMSVEEKGQVFTYWKRAPRDIRPEIAIYIESDGISGLISYLDDLVRELKIQEQRQRLENEEKGLVVEETIFSPPEEEREFQVTYAKNESGESTFDEWFSNLRNPLAKQAVLSRIERLKAGHFGDSRRLVINRDIVEVRIHINGGARIYVTQQPDKLEILWGGTKFTQRSDIATANKLCQLLN